MAQRAASLLAAYVAAGTSHIRSHVGVDTVAGLDSLHGVMEAREVFAEPGRHRPDRRADPRPRPGRQGDRQPRLRPGRGAGAAVGPAGRGAGRPALSLTTVAPGNRPPLPLARLRAAGVAVGLELATAGGAGVFGLDGHGLEPGCWADLALVPASTVGEAVVAHPPRSLVLKRGRVVAGA